MFWSSVGVDVSYGCIGANEEKVGCTFAIIIGLGVLLQLFFKKGVFLLFHSALKTFKITQFGFS